jgi:hypothetical protein
MAETASQSGARDLLGLLFDMEDDVLSVLDFLHAINAIGNSTIGLGPEQTSGLLRVAMAGLDSASSLRETWLRALELAKAAKRQAEAA